MTRAKRLRRRRSSVISLDQIKAALQLDALQAQHRLDVKILETTVVTAKNVEPGFQWLTDKVDYA